MRYKLGFEMFAFICLLLMIISPPVFSQQQDPDLQRGIAEFNQENYDEALGYLLKARRAQIESSLPAYYLGVTYKNLENYREAKKYLKEAVKLSPEIKEALMELADVQYRLGEYKEALKAVESADQKKIRPGQTAFLKGLILMEMDDNYAAVESFKTAAALSPQLVQAANYQIGLAYLKANELEEAESGFNNVISKDPNTDMAAYASHYMESIGKKKKEKVPYRFYLGYHFQFDDNVLLRPSDSSAASSISNEDDYLHLITAGIEYLPERKGPINYSAHYNLYSSFHNDLASYDVQSHNFVFVPTYRLDDVSSLDLALGYNHSWVDDDDYLSTVTISPTYTLLYEKNQTYQLYLSYQRKDFIFEPAAGGDEDRDADDYSINLNAYYFFDQNQSIFVPFMESFQLSSFAENKGYFNLLYKLNKEETDGKNWENFGNTAIATVLLSFSEKNKISFSGEIKYQDYSNKQLDSSDGVSKERLDLTYGISALYYWKFHKYANLQLLYSYRRDDSNIAVYDYKRNLYSVGVELRY